MTLLVAVWDMVGSGSESGRREWLLSPWVDSPPAKAAAEHSLTDAKANSVHPAQRDDGSDIVEVVRSELATCVR